MGRHNEDFPLKFELEIIAQGISQTMDAVRHGEYSVLKEALKGVYNVMSGFLRRSDVPDDIREGISRIADSIYDSRELMVNQIEVGHRTPVEATYNAEIPRKLETISKSVKDYLDKLG